MLSVFFINYRLCVIAEKNSLTRNLQETNKALTQLEDAKSNLEKDSEELRSSVREIECARQQARREIQQLHNQVGTLHLSSLELLASLVFLTLFSYFFLYSSVLCPLM